MVKSSMFKDMSSIFHLLAPSLGQMAINGGFSFQKIQLKWSDGQKTKTSMTNNKEYAIKEITLEPKKMEKEMPDKILGLT